LCATGGTSGEKSVLCQPRRYSAFDVFSPVLSFCFFFPISALQTTSQTRKKNLEENAELFICEKVGKVLEVSACWTPLKR
jgi:hypothetical protein